MPITSTSSSARGRRDLRRRRADALVDDLHAGVAGGDGDLLGAVAVAVETGLGHQEPGRPAVHGPHPGRHVVHQGAPMADRRGDAGRRPVLAEHVTHGARPIRPSSRRRAPSAIVAGMTFSPPRAAAPQLGERRGDGRRRRVRRATRRRRRPSPPRPPDRRAGSTPRRRAARASASVKRLTPTTVCSPVSMRRLRSAWEVTRRDFISSIASNTPPRPRMASSSARRLLDERRVRGLDDVRPVEDVLVLEQVGLEREHLLVAQRPLLIPRPGQAQRLVPRRQLRRPGRGRRATASRRASRG